MIDLTGYLIVGASAAVATAGATKGVEILAHKKGWLAEPDERRLHPVPTPNVGGLAFLVGLIAALLLASRMDRFSSVISGNSELIGVLIAAVVITVLGFVDDIRELSPPMKVTGVVAVGIVLVWFGVTMFYFRLPFLDVFVLSNDWIPLFTVVWLLGMTQAINLIDGLDGLATGIVAIAAGSFFVYSKHLGDLGLLAEPNIGPLISIITLGICIGFLPFNFNPAKIFMGDCGALMLGLLMAIATSVVGGRADRSWPLASPLDRSWARPTTRGRNLVVLDCVVVGGGLVSRAQQFVSQLPAIDCGGSDSGSLHRAASTVASGQRNHRNQRLRLHKRTSGLVGLGLRV